MCSPQNQTIIDAVIADFVGQSRAFTAYDVSKEAQTRGANERHRDMRAYIHSAEPLQNALGFGDYEKTVLNLTSCEQPLLYHHTNYNPQDYQPTNGKTQSATSFNPIAPGASIAVFDPNVNGGGATYVDPNAPSIAGSISVNHIRHKNDDGTFGLGQEKRLLIETKYVKACGLNPGDTAYVYAENDKLILSKTNPGNGRARRIEKKGDLRISQISLREAGFSCTNFKVENKDFNNNTVVEVSAV